MPVPVVAELEQHRLGVLAVLGRAPHRRRLLVELHRHGRQPVATARRRSRPRRCSRWRSPADRRAAPRPTASAPTARRAGQQACFHSSKRAPGELGVELGARTRRCSRAGREVDEPGIIDAGRARPSSRQKSGQYRSASRNTSWMWRPSLVRYDPTSGFGAGAPARGRGAAVRPGARPARRTTASTSRWPAATRRRPSPAPVRSRCSSAAAIPKASAIAPLRSPIAPRWLIGSSRSGGREDVGQAAAGPEGGGVVARLVGVGPADAVAVTAGVDQAGVALGQRLGVEARACAAPRAAGW